MEREATELRQALRIEIHRLHEQCAEQPALYLQAAEIVAEAKAAAKRAKLAYEEKRAGVELKLRADPKKFGFDKLTEGLVSSWVVTQPRVAAAATAVVDAERASDGAAALERAWDQRRSMLNAETNLFVANYWGDRHVGESPDAEAQRTRDAVVRRRKEG